MGDRKRILLVDDYEPYRACVAHYLRTAMNAEVVEARDGLMALDQLRTRSFDVLVVDVEMPQMDGIALFQCLPPELEARTVFVTGGERLERQDWLARFDRTRLLRKPVAFERLGAVVSAIVASRGAHDG